MKKIKLTQDKFALVDDVDFEWLNQWKWYCLRGYAVRGVQPKIFMHRLINNTPKGFDTDHINRNTFDNQRENLRTATRSQNQHNTKMRKDNTSGITNIFWNSWNKKWRVQLNLNKKRIELGCFGSLNDAIKAKMEGVKKYYATI